MTTVCDYYGITGHVPFLNVDAYVDNRMYVDPFKIRMRLGPTTFADAANVCTSSFFNEITSSVISGNPAKRARGLDLLQHFEEPRETRLGMSKFGCDGHGGADGVGEAIWSVLNGDASVLVNVGVLHQIEDIPLFVPGVGNDITSDLVTRIIFGPLADFTSDCVASFPQLAGGTGLKKFDRQTWDPIAARWTMKKVTLPTVDHRPLLLVPTEWATTNLLLNATRLYDTALLSHVQDERAVVTEKGKVLKTPKDRLRQDPGLARSYDTIIRIVVEAYGKNSDIVAKFKAWAEMRFRDSA